MMPRGRGRPKTPNGHKVLRAKIAEAKSCQRSSVGLPRVVCDAWLLLVIITHKGSITAVDLAECTDLGVHKVRMILKRLVVYGIVKGHNYRGYSLRRAPSSVTLLDVTQALCEEKLGGVLTSKTEKYPWFVGWYSDVCSYAWAAYASTLGNVTLSGCIRSAPDDVYGD